TAPLQSTYGVEEIAKGGRCSVASQLGKRYRCKVCGTEVLCVKAGEGSVNCDGQEMELVQPRPIPSSD
ncbi:MAG: hypothetical protein MUO99_05820, partial [Dehalococcoidales bacterium]|nr:hypothetical protein [Dehalococcoidales bacterium]